MAYKVFFSYANGAKSHALMTDSSRDAKLHLDGLLAETEPRKMAKQIIIMNGHEIILEALTTSTDDEIRAAARWRKAGTPQRMLDPVTASIYMPKAAKEMLMEKGGGSLAAGMRQLLLAVGGKEMAIAYMQEPKPVEKHAQVA